MKKSSILILIILTVFGLLNSCVDKLVVPDETTEGKLVVQSVPQGAEIYLLGNKTEKITPDSLLNLDGGTYTITLRKENYTDTTITFKVYDNLTTTLSVILESNINSGVLSLNSIPDSAQIFLSGVNIRRTTPFTVNLSEGVYIITLKKENYSDTTFNITINNGDTTKREINLKSLTKPGKIVVNSDPAGAQIFLNDSNTEKVTPDSLELQPGNYEITLKLSEYKDTTFNVSLNENQRIEKNISLTKSAAKGSVFLESEPSGAQIFLNGTNTNKSTPDSITNLEAGDYIFNLRLTGYKDTTFNVTVVKDQKTSKKITLQKALERGSIFLESEPNGAQIFLASSNTNKFTPDSITSLKAGTYTFTLKLNGYRDTTFNVIVNKDKRTNKKVTLTEFVTAGSAFIESKPAGAKIFLDGINTDKTTPNTINDIEEGNHQFKLTLEGYRDTTFNLDIVRNQQINKNIELTKIITTGSAFIESKPAGAKIFLDGINTDKVTPNTINDIEEGNHQFKLTLEGYRDTTFNLDIVRNQQINKNIELTKIITTGSAFIESKPAGAKIFLDGTNTGKTTPNTINDIEEGNHQFKLTLEGYRDTTFNLDIVRNQQVNKNIELTKIITTGSAFIESNPAGAKIFLDGTNTDKVTPNTINDIEEGNHQFKLTLEGYRDTTFNLDIIRNQQVNKNIELTKEITTGMLTITSEPSGADISLDGNDIDRETPETIENIEAGSHSVTLELDDYQDTTFNVEIKKGELTSVNIILIEENPVKVDELYYDYRGLIFQSTRFYFSFDQDVRLDKVEIVEKGNTNPATIQFDEDDNIKKNDRESFDISGRLTGTFILTFYGRKSGGTRADFILQAEITLP